jgi:hypothetical protein
MPLRPIPATAEARFRDDLPTRFIFELEEIVRLHLRQELILMAF